MDREIPGVVLLSKKVEDMNTKEFRRTLIAIYTFRIFCGGMACCIPVIVLFWKHYGMSLTQIMILQSFFALMLVCFEVPSGYCADLWGRKRVLVIASLFLTCGAGVYLFAERYWHFFMSEIFFALGISLISGTMSALLYDALMERNREEEYGRIWGSMQAASLISCALFTSMGGVLYEWHNRLPFLISLILTVGTFPSALCMHEPKRSKPQHKKGYLRGLMSVVVPAVAKNIEYRNLLITYALVFTFVQSGVWFYQPYFQLCGIATFWYGFIFTAFNLIAALGSKLTGPFDKHSEKLGLGSVPLVAVAISYFGMSMCWFSFGFVVIFIQQIVRGWFFVTISQRIHRQVSSSERATLLSLCSMSGSCTYAAFLPLAGVVADTCSITIALQACGFLCLVSALVGVTAAGFKKWEVPFLSPDND